MESVTAIDQFGNTQPGYAGDVTLNWSGPDSAPDDVSTPHYDNPVHFAGGTGTAQVILYDAEHTAIFVNDTTLFGSTDAFDVAAAPMQGFYVPNPGTQTAGVSFTEPVSAVDAFRNLIAGYSGGVQWSGPSGIGGYTPSYSATTLSGGTGSAGITLYAAETTGLNVSDSGGFAGTTGSFTVNPASTSVLQLTVAYSSVTPATQDSGSVSAFDLYGNLNALDNATLGVQYNPTDPLCSGATCDATVSLSAGQGSFNFILVSQGTYEVTVSGEGVTSNAAQVDVTLGP
jgi:hypothetical protein